MGVPIAKWAEPGDDGDDDVRHSRPPSIDTRQPLCSAARTIARPGTTSGLSKAVFLVMRRNH